MDLKTFAERISRLFNPLVVLLPLIFLSLTISGLETSKAILWTTLTGLFILLPIGFFLSTRMKSFLVENQKRENRFPVFFIAIINTFILCMLASLLSSPYQIWIFLGSAFITELVGLYLNNFIKFSGHTAGLSFFAMYLSPHAPVLAGTILGATFLTGWSRHRLGAHTLNELVVGFLAPLPGIIFILVMT